MWPPDQAERFSSQAASLGAGELTRAAEVIATGLTEMRGTTAPRLHLELMCARVLLPGADVDDRGLHARLDRLERRIGVTEGAPARASTSAVLSSSKGSRPVAVPAEPAEEPPAKPASPASPEPADLRPEPFDKLRTAPYDKLSTAPVEDPAERAAASSAPPPTSPAEITQLTVGDVRRLWPEVLEEVKGKRRFTWILLSQNAQVAEIRNGTLLLAMSNAGARDSFARGGSEDVLREAMVVVMGADFAVETMVDPSAAPATGAPRTPPLGEPPDAATASTPCVESPRRQWRRYRHDGGSAIRSRAVTTVTSRRIRSRKPNCSRVISARRSSLRRITAHRLGRARTSTRKARDDSRRRHVRTAGSGSGDAGAVDQRPAGAGRHADRGLCRRRPGHRDSHGR